MVQRNTIFLHVLVFKKMFKPMSCSGSHIRARTEKLGIQPNQKKFSGKSYMFERKEVEPQGSHDRGGERKL